MKKANTTTFTTALYFLAACSGGGDGPGGVYSNESTLGSDFETYTETSVDGLQMTNYVLSMEGMKIIGSFEDANDKADAYQFNTGTYRRVDVYVFIDGVRQNEENSQVYISLNNALNDGYSTIQGNGYFINALVAPTGESYQDYILYIGQHPDVDISGSTYAIEIKAVE